VESLQDVLQGEVLWATGNASGHNTAEDLIAVIYHRYGILT
jgi:hypothetical protein